MPWVPLPVLPVLSGLVPVQQVRQAVQVLRNQDRHPRRLRHQVEAPAHLKSFRQHSKFLAERVQVKARKFPFHPHKKQLSLGILMLVGMRNIGAISIQKVGNTRHQTLPVRAIDQKNRRIPHILVIR